MRITLEFFGLSRLVVGKKDISLDLEEGATFRDIVRKLAAMYPELVGNVIQPDGASLQHPNAFNLNAKRMIRADQMDEHPNDGDRIILMSMSAGG